VALGALTVGARAEPTWLTTKPVTTTPIGPWDIKYQPTAQTGSGACKLPTLTPRSTVLAKLTTGSGEPVNGDIGTAFLHAKFDQTGSTIAYIYDDRRGSVVDDDESVKIPEPATPLLLAMGLGALVLILRVRSRLNVK
jgi:hypothetical protein